MAPGAVAQLVERIHGMDEVARSIRVGSTESCVQGIVHTFDPTPCDNVGVGSPAACKPSPGTASADVRVEEVPDPHELFGPFIDPGDVLGHVPPTN